MKKFIPLVIFLLIFSVFQFIPKITEAALVGNTTQATLSLSPQTGSYNVNDTFTVSIYANTNGQNVVVVAAYLNYNKTNFQAVSVDLTGSAFTMNFENVIDSTNGKIKITQAIPTPGVNSTNALVAKVNFKALSTIAPSSDNITFDFTSGSTVDSGVLKDDGNGTDILSGVYNAKFTVTVPDATAPVISNVVSTPAVNAANITWTTDELATSQINYGLTSNYTSTSTLDSTLVSSHSVNLSGLTAHTTYHYRIRTKDAAGNERVSGDYTFATNNSVPVMVSIIITPNPAYKSTASLTANPTSSDADGDAITYTYQWKKGGVNINGQTASTLGNANYVKGDVITVAVTPNDGRVSGSAMTSANLTISDSAPTQPTVSVTNPAYDSSNLICTVASASNDIDSADSIVYNYAWYKNTVLQASLTTSTVNASYTSVGDIWKCVVTPSDGTINGTPAEGSTTILANLDVVAPVISNAASAVTTTSATITWTTNEAATSQINYGLTASYNATTTLDSSLITSHSVTISALTPNTTYHYRIRTKDAAGNEQISGDYTFKTIATSDLNSDGRVNSVDASILLSYWRYTTKPRADINQDGLVNLTDVAIMMSQWTN